MTGRKYRVLVEFADGDSWSKDFDKWHEAVEEYMESVGLSAIAQYDSTVKLIAVEGCELRTALLGKFSRAPWV